MPTMQIEQAVADAKQHQCQARVTSRFFKNALILIIAASGFAAEGGESGSRINLADDEAMRIGRLVWQNECGGSVEGLTTWNAGEQFASMGIGHFLWYPPGQDGPFEEKFPAMLVFLRSRGIKLPPVFSRAPNIDCPWKDRASFLRDLNSEPMRQMRAFLATTVAGQARFLVLRLEQALPKMLAECEPAERSRVESRFYKVANARGGAYALVDYVNFKGEGTNPNERYKGQGWGLLQVLQNMTDDGDPLQNFSASAKAMLQRRVRNSPPKRNEARWLPGWLNRVSGYAG